MTLKGDFELVIDEGYDGQQGIDKIVEMYQN